ncbi:hypothetical protein [Gimesia aquarii]|uniref:Uncharacterized protein n=1 Tax=Gimesia aquarii TaxID=2527964 RepID=A0A517X1T4_9PLAN|nr:hypothetical protein [Gimesia aquarii]QDU11460.1 hypothetical protein V202x_48820 [Gimesia aquarii]
MKNYLQFLLTGLILGLFTEVELKLIAGINPSMFITVLFAYRVILTMSYAGSKLLGRFISSQWKGDLLHYSAAGFFGLAIEWILLGNGPGSNSLQLGMFAMWTTFCFGPRILTRDSPAIKKDRRKFWIAFAVAAMLITTVVLLAPHLKAKIVITALALSGTYLIWSIWLLILVWQSNRNIQLATTIHDA